MAVQGPGTHARAEHEYGELKVWFGILNGTLKSTIKHHLKVWLAGTTSVLVRYICCAACVMDGNALSQWAGLGHSCGVNM